MRTRAAAWTCRRTTGGGVASAASAATPFSRRRRTASTGLWSGVAVGAGDDINVASLRCPGEIHHHHHSNPLRLQVLDGACQTAARGPTATPAARPVHLSTAPQFVEVCGRFNTQPTDASAVGDIFRNRDWRQVLYA